MKWHPLKKSSVFTQGAWDSRKKLMYLQFRRNGRFYCYHGANTKAWKEFLQAESHGKHFNRAILKLFRCEKMPVWFSV